MPNLFPESYESEIITAEEVEGSKVVGYKNGVQFDDILGDFVRDGRNQLLDNDGIESWKSWCTNVLQIERYRYLAYGTDIGIEIEAAMKSASRDEAESILTRQITEAIMADPYERAEYVQDIKFNWTAPDTVEVEVTIKGKDDVTIDVTAYITKGE